MIQVTIFANEDDLNLIEDLFSAEQTEDERVKSIEAVKRLWQTIVEAKNDPDN
jgi:hypothetical protein